MGSRWQAGRARLGGPGQTAAASVVGLVGWMPAGRGDGRPAARRSGCHRRGARCPAAAAGTPALARRCAGARWWSRPAAVDLGLHHPTAQRLGRGAGLARHWGGGAEALAGLLDRLQHPSRQLTSEGSTRGDGRRFPSQPRRPHRLIESSERLGRHRWTIERTGPGWVASGGCGCAMSETPSGSMPWCCWPAR
jgi:hypothetical protein